jgi:sugar phosphate isomerase/epimerase
MRSAQTLGAEHYTFHGTARFKKASRDPACDNLERMGECIREIGEFCAPFGVRLCLENVEWATYNRVGVFAEMKKYYPALRGVLDVKQARISGEGYLPYLREMGESISTVHLSDVDENGRMCLPGQGVTDFETLVKALRDVGFGGPLLIEAYKDDYTEINQLKNSCEFLQEIVYKIQ